MSDVTKRIKCIIAILSVMVMGLATTTAKLYTENRQLDQKWATVSNSQNAQITDLMQQNMNLMIQNARLMDNSMKYKIQQ